MVVNGLTLPATFEQVISQVDVTRHWELKEYEDAYGDYWMTDFELWTDLETMHQWTNWLPNWLKIDRLTQEETDKRDAEAARCTGFIPFITDFAQIVQFGRNGSGDPFCFDFREDPQEPSIIFWDEYYWRLVAPNFETFITLFKPVDLRETLDRIHQHERLMSEWGSLQSEEERQRFWERLRVDRS
jgi:hypothetical protein